MNKEATIIGPALPGIPWEEKPAGCRDVVWRYTRNPIIPRDLIPTANSIFNSAVVPHQGGFAGIFRCDDKTRQSKLYAGRSTDGINWEIDHDPIRFDPEGGGLEAIVPGYEQREPRLWPRADGKRGRIAHGYDPRVCWLADRYYITWANIIDGPTVGLAYTFDFKAFHQLENPVLPYNRNGVLFPRKIQGKYALLSRPSDRGHTPFGDIFYSESPDLIYWGRHRPVMSTVKGWQSTKIGAGPGPIETTEGWLLIYHGVLNSCNGYVYSAGAALLDLDEPWRVRYRTHPYILSPRTLYECVGDVPNVVFPCAALCDAPTGRIAIYYGGADTVTCLAFAQVDELIAFVKDNSL
ncbi:MAG: glycoside hydrolase family 130 protein [Bacteroidota bacterium]